jgi:hypothetical protein
MVKDELVFAARECDAFIFPQVALQTAWLNNTVSPIAPSASTASFQKSRRCLRPGKPSGLMSWIAIMAMMTSDSALDMAVFEQQCGWLSKWLSGCLLNAGQLRLKDPHP